MKRLMKRLEGKTAVITGAGSGIGKATALRFAEEGANVVIAEINQQAGIATANEIESSGGHARFVHCDVSDEQSVCSMVDSAVEAYDAIHILVNNAAAFVLKGIDATVDDWRKILDVNVVGTALVSKHCMPAIKQAGGGAVVNLGSISSFIAQPEFVTYNTTKAAIAGMTRCMALDLAPYNIRVNAVCPGTVWTPIVQQMIADAGLTREEADAHPDWGAAHMIPRLADAREIANAILFLVSDEASFITAECLMVDGGYTAR